MICKICNKEFIKQHFNQRYCSEECRHIAKRNSQKKYRKTEKGKLNNRKQKFMRRTMKPVDKLVLKKLMEQSICYYCGKEITGLKTIDHKIPVSRGGNNKGNNLVLCCKHCNSQKNEKTEEEYIEWLKLNAQKQEK